jgi:hypothetical protein
MANLIVIRLHPDKSIAGAEFANFLTGLSITAFDLSCGDPKVGTNIGNSGYLPPPDPAKPWEPDPASGIVQHFTIPFFPFPPTAEAVATAVIVVTLPSGYREYVTPDLRIELTRGGTTFSDKNLYYDVEILSVGSLPSSDSFPALGPPSLYLKLPTPVAPGLASLELNDDGSPPNFQALKNAVTIVLSADQQPNPPAVIGALTADQARHIAFEIVWGAQDPLPDPPPAPPPSGLGTFDALGALYTNPPNDGTVGNPVEQNRQQFEGSLNSYYATHNANVERLARFILALSAAVACEALSQNAGTALVQFPVTPGTVGTQTTITTAEVLLVDGTGGGGPLVPAFLVPAQYFYVLGAQLPAEVGAEQRFRMACRDNQERLLPILSAAFDDGTLSPNPAINPAQAVRRMTALAPEHETGTPQCRLDASVLPLVNDWLDFPDLANWLTYQPGDDPVKFWAPESLTEPLPYLNLVLCALTDGYQPLIDALLALPVASVAGVAALTEAQWKSLFGTPPNVSLLPPFTLPGTPEARLAAFIRRVQKFFDMSPDLSAIPLAEADLPPVLDLPGVDFFAQFVAQYELLIGAPFHFGSGPLNEAQVQAAVQVVFTDDPAAQSWLSQRVHVVNELCLLAGVVSSTTIPPILAPAFSMAEALYARGFTGAQDIIPLSLADFSAALRGTVAFDQAAAIYARAGAVGPPPPPPSGPFVPINPGSLVDCIPPCYLSPLGPVQYLHELLNLSEASTCQEPFAAPPPGKPTLGEVVAGRRGPLGDLAVTAANAQTEIPLIDIVNENLEHLVATLPAAPAGVVHDTAGDFLGGHMLCAPEPWGDDAGTKKPCHQPDALFGALAEHSSPAVPVAEPAAYDRLKLDFCAPTLPYSQPLDICRSYLERLGSCRFEAMRTFRQEITEFALDPGLPEPVFQSHLWRYPVRIDIAIEYLGINPEEFDLLFTKEIVDSPTPGYLVLYQLYGYEVPNPGGLDWAVAVLALPEFLKRTGLSYCELVLLQKSGCFGFVVEQVDNHQGVNPVDLAPLQRGAGGDLAKDAIEVELAAGQNAPKSSFTRKDFSGLLPECEPCCLELYRIRFTSPTEQVEALRKLVLFLRLWRKLQLVCGARYSFAQLCDICDVLQLFLGTAINPDFIRQLAAFQMLRDRFRLKLTDGPPLPGTHGAERTHLLALWVGTTAPRWGWAVGQLLERVQHFAKNRHQCHERAPHFVKLLAVNLDPLSILAGFDPARPSDTWQARPANTLRFAEILAKIYASPFGVGELLYLFGADDHLDGDDPFPLQDQNEAQDNPLDLPEDEEEHSLWALRRKLLCAQECEEDACGWSWQRIEAALRHEFGYQVPSGGTDYLLSLGRHFFPTVLERSGTPVGTSDRQYRVSLAGASPEMWNIPPDGPFRFDAAADELWTQLPLRDEAVIETLERLRDLSAPERAALQEIYFLPRLDLAPFACFFPSLAEAERHLIEEPEEEKRWHWFRGHFALAYRRCRMVADHLARHVGAATGCSWQDGEPTAWLILKKLLADENLALGPWEADSGVPPEVTWSPLPSGGGFAALLGLTGTGLPGELSRAGGVPAWREVRGPLCAFGPEQNEHNAPVPTMLPALDLALTPEQLRFVGLRNGFAVQDQNGRMLGGAEGFLAHWSGVLLVDEEGKYQFSASAPAPEGKEHEGNEQHEGKELDCGCGERARWRVTLTRGQKTWIILSHRWPGERGEVESCLQLKRGAYGISVEFDQPPPEFAGVDDIFPQHTGFLVRYDGPDTGCEPETLPLTRLFRDKKDTTLDQGIRAAAAGSAGLFLKLHYTSTLRDIRRTYQRAFKALLFAQRFELSGHALPSYRQSELGYLLDHADLFAGVSYYRHPLAFSRHEANFDFNFIPLKDQYLPPPPLQDQRVQPSAQRRQALFDWWERIFDYTRMRRERESVRERPVWLLFEEALEKQPDNPAQLLRHLDIDLRHAGLVLGYFQGQATPVYEVTSHDLEDDRWAVRAWHGDRWVRRLLRDFLPSDISEALPDLWASDDPGSLVVGETMTGNGNLSGFLGDGCLENGEPPRYLELSCLNDGLRERARYALLSYLCGMSRVPLPWGGTATCAKDLSELLLLDVETGLCQRASRIEEAVSAVQNFVQRARLGLEPGWSISGAFLKLWNHEFELFRIWEKCKCRLLYKENWIDWDELRQARKIEAFQFLEAELRRNSLTIAIPGGLEYWPETLPPVHPALKLLQERDPSALRLLEPSREGLGLLGTPERDARPSWLAPDFAPQIIIENPEAVRPYDPIGTPGSPTAADPLQDAGQFPFWIQAAIRLGTKFFRIAAGGVPPAAAKFRPSDFHQEPGCCCECGSIHPPLVDEYYFWLVGSRVFDAPDQEEYYDPELQVSEPWHDPDTLPTLLDWKSASAVRLAWCRVHNGEFKQPRRSDDAVQLSSGSLPDLVFLGRVGDSLTFAVSGGEAPVGYHGTDAPGFRFDLAADASVPLPLIADPPAAPSAYPAGLPVYPYFAFDEPGDRLFPDSPFSPALAVAGVLRCHCRFEAALKWYRLVLDPLSSDNTWVYCQSENPPDGSIAVNPASGSCCDSTRISAEAARRRAIVLKYLETLLEWSAALMRQNSRETAQQARLVLDAAARILGPCPRTVLNHEPQQPATVAGFVALAPPLNPRLMEIYCRVRDGLTLVRRCLTEERLRSTQSDCRAPYWGQQPCDCGSFGSGCGCATLDEPCCDLDHGCQPPSPYRFVFLVQKAQEAAARVREFGNQLLAAFDRGDAEYLASVRARHEVQLSDLTVQVRQEQWRESDWQVKALGKTKEVSQTNRRYFKQLIDVGLINEELDYQSNTNNSADLRSRAIRDEETGAALRLIPDLFVGFPCEESWLALGTKLGEMFEVLARITNENAEIAGTNASLDLTQAGWQRRLDEWVHQVEILDLEIEQIEIQILGAERHRDQALEELNLQQRQLEQSREVLDLLRDQFTSHELYLYLQKETAALHGKMYELARHLAEEAQRAFNFELGHLNRNFLCREDWDNLHEGLLAGERLELALQRMDAEYLDCNRREYELTKHISLALQFPLQFLRLKLTGCCEIEIPEWMFDMDYPGHYLRRIKCFSMTIPCVTGPYTGVHCRLTLLSSQTRIDPCLSCSVTDCCHEKPVSPCDCHHEPEEHYEPCRGDRRVVRSYGAREAIATSSGRNDAGLFELNFRDERHLPFEFFGAVSCWRIELPPENNFFDLDSLTDLVLHANYTAREGGDALRQAARASAGRKLPGNGWIYLDLRKDFPDAWELFRRSRKNRESERSLTVKITRKLFPFLPGDPALEICKLAVLFETPESCGPCCPEIRECPCAHGDMPGSHLVEITVDRTDEDRDDCRELELECVSSPAAPHLYHGVGEIKLGPLDRCHECHSMTFSFEDRCCEPSRAFLLLRYRVMDVCCGNQGPVKLEH